MEFYFAVSEKMITDKFSMPSGLESGTLIWRINNNTVYGQALVGTVGKLMEILKASNLMNETFAICKCKIDDSKAIEIIDSGLNGERIDFAVVITEIHWVKKQLI